MNMKELERGMPSIFQLTNNEGEVVLHKPEGHVPMQSEMDTLNTTLEGEEKVFTFDHAYDETSTQVEVYDQCAKSIVHNVLEGYNGTIFAYG
jgi:centromeric protein E